ncbi:MAG: carboxylating nicotinate-nucleotide diphosphorylase [Phycisphaeraceae bacterium]
MTEDTRPQLESFINSDTLSALIQRARAEDLGPDNIDVTADAFIPPDRAAEAQMVPRAPGILAGAALLPHIAAAYDENLKVALLARDGAALRPGEPAARFTGQLRAMLMMERVALNFVTHLSGIATLTAQYVTQTAGTNAHICDTRKTIPGLRGLAKYAVACGGGTTHRVGLYDAMLIKDNHLAGVTVKALPQVLRDALARAAHHDLKFIEVEVDTLAQLEQVLTVREVDMILLDNMSTDQLRKAVARRDALAPDTLLEASGGVNLETVAAIAATGVDRISVGALTHSAPALDLGLDIQ